jgi:hypothetical protein
MRHGRESNHRACANGKSAAAVSARREPWTRDRPGLAAARAEHHLYKARRTLIIQPAREIRLRASEAKELSMSKKPVGILISAIGIGAMLTLPAVARTLVSHHAIYARAYAGPPHGLPGTPLPLAHTGQRYNGPYNEKIITSPNGIVAGTDPDASIRAYMRRDSGGAGAAGSGFGSP